MPDSTDHAYPPRLRRLIAIVLALALPVVAVAAARVAAEPPAAGEALAVVLFLGLALLAELKPVPLEERNLSTVSLAFVFILAGLMLFGWEYGVLIASVSALVAQLVERRPPARTAYNTAVYALAAFVAALPAFGWGAFDDRASITVHALWGGAAFVLLNVTCISLAISFHERIPLAPLLVEDFRLAGPAFGIQACLAALGAVLWATEPWLLVLMAGPLFTVTLYQRSSLASRIATRDAHTDSLTRLGNHRAYELSIAAALEAAAEVGEPLSLCLVDIDDFKLVNDTFGHPLGDQVLLEVAEFLASSLPDGACAFRLGGDEFALLLSCGQDEARRQAEDLNLRISDATFSHRARVSVSVGVAIFPAHAADAEQLERVADSALYWAKQNGKNRACIYDPEHVRLYSLDELERRAERQARLRAAENLVRVVDAKDEYTGAHSERVARHVEGIARELGLADEVVEQVKLAGSLHDLGKIAASDQVLQKPARLTEDEQAHLAAHPVLGAALLDGMDIRPIDLWIRHHHEHWDGSGYPDGLVGEEIPFGSRVILVADAYDAITSERSYRPAASPEVALAELHRMAGVQFDPAVVAALEAYLVEDGLVGSDDGRRGQLVA